MEEVAAEENKFNFLSARSMRRINCDWLTSHSWTNILQRADSFSGNLNLVWYINPIIFLPLRSQVKESAESEVICTKYLGLRIRTRRLTCGGA